MAVVAEQRGALRAQPGQLHDEPTVVIGAAEATAEGGGEQPLAYLPALQRCQLLLVGEVLQIQHVLAVVAEGAAVLGGRGDGARGEPGQFVGAFQDERGGLRTGEQILLEGGACGGDPRVQLAQPL